MTTDLAARVSHEASMLAERFRRLGAARLAAAFPPHPSRADAGHAMAQALADATLGVERRRAAARPANRVVPRLGDHAVGDQVAVTGRELADALLGVDPAEPVWSAHGTEPTARVVDGLCERMRRLRLEI